MPHECTECGHVFPDGSKEMLSGCPDCGGNKFQFRPASDARDAGSGSDVSADATSDDSTSRDPTSADSTSTGPGSEPATPTEPESVADRTPHDDESPPETTGVDESTDEPAERTETPSKPAETADSSESADSSTTDVASLRRELDDQFESIKILEPGQYELNLMELYNREERIIALREDGQYVIDVPDTWLGDDEGE